MNCTVLLLVIQDNEGLINGLGTLSGSHYFCGGRRVENEQKFSHSVINAFQRSRVPVICEITYHQSDERTLICVLVVLTIFPSQWPLVREPKMQLVSCLNEFNPRAENQSIVRYKKHRASKREWKSV